MQSFPMGHSCRAAGPPSDRRRRRRRVSAATMIFVEGCMSTWQETHVLLNWFTWTSDELAANNEGLLTQCLLPVTG